MTVLTTEAALPMSAGLPSTTRAAHGWTLLRSGTARTLHQTVTGEDREILTETALAVCASLTPAKPEQIAVALESLALHYPRFERTKAESRIANGHWIDDLAEWPADIIAEACRQWRNSSERFFPTPGQLKASCEKTIAARKIIAERATEFLQLAEAQS